MLMLKKKKYNKTQLPYFEHNMNFPLKSKTVNFNYSLMSTSYIIAEKPNERSTKKVIILGTKMTNLHNFGRNKIFLKNPKQKINPPHVCHHL